MLSLALQFLMFGSFFALVVLAWRLCSRPGWRARVVVYGWGVSVVWGVLWALVVPMGLKSMMAPEELHRIFPDGQLVAGFLFGGWFWPLIVVVLHSYRDRVRLRVQE